MLTGGEKRAHDYCSSCTLYLGAIVVVLLCQALAGFVAAGLQGSVPDIAQNGDFNAAFMIVIQVIVGAYIILFDKLSKRKFNFIAVNEGQSSKPHFTAFVVPIAIAAALMCGMFLPTIWYGYFTQYVLGISPEVGQINVDTPSAVVMLVIASVFLAPVCEEAVYRGVLFNGLKSERSVISAVLLSALAFMLMHMSPAQVVFQFALGAVSALIMLKSNRLVSCVMLHASANALALVIELTSLGEVLSSCVMWLTANIAAAFFITLVLFSAAGAIIYVLLRFCFKNAAKSASEPEEEEPDENKRAANAGLKAIRKNDGTIRYAIAASLCGLLFIVNAVAGMIL